MGLRAEAAIAARLGVPVAAGGGTPAGAGAAAARLVAQGCSGLVSFGLAGGLDPSLRPGTIIVPSSVLSEQERLYVDAGLAGRFGGADRLTILAGSEVAADRAAKRRLFEATGAQAIDLESGAVAQIAAAHGLPFAVVRAVCDPAERDLPPAALLALDGQGRIAVGRVAGSLVARPWQLFGLLRLASDAAKARRALVALTVRVQTGASMSRR